MAYVTLNFETVLSRSSFEAFRGRVQSVEQLPKNSCSQQGGPFRAKMRRKISLGLDEKLSLDDLKFFPLLSRLTSFRFSQQGRHPFVRKDFQPWHCPWT